MYAAVVTSFDGSPTYQEFPVPTPRSADEVLVDVLAVGLHPRVRSQADGSHYTSTGDLPLVPGVDGVGRTPDGALRYFVSDGAMAERAVIDIRRSVVLPDDVDPIAVAAAMNPAMSSWVALRRRIDFRAGQSVLVLGATGNAGRLAIQVARRLGAGRVIGVGRNADRLAGLDADEVVAFDADLGAVAADVDVVIDYVWGQPAADAMRAIITDRPDRGQPLAWIQIGSVAGPDAPIPSAALRAARLQIVGSGQGSVPTGDILAELPTLAAEITAGTFGVEARPVPLADVESAWKDAASDRRIVITP
jgi:NADPH:quinone reductase-like Zn-dependent oxidoreductase